MTISETAQAPKPEAEPTLLVQPKGYRILAVLHRAPEKSDGGIIIPENLKDRQDLAQCVGYVVAMGPDCFKDKDRWPSGEPLCEVGDYILFRSFAGTRFMITGSEHEYRILNDDAVEAVVMDPNRVRRAQ